MTYPEPVARLDAEERTRRVVGTDDFCSYTDSDGSSRHFARGLLEIPIPEEASYFGYGAWVELDEPQIERLASIWRDPEGANEAPFQGLLANELAPYVGTEGLAATLRLREVDRLPRVDVRGPHVLADECRGGISASRARELAQVVLHPPGS